ncbi:MAG TPA: hypothetical protein P5096_01185 [Patescibacteria group bacterium]|nr:hypothetical protein [Patescibacteria group bacterium]
MATNLDFNSIVSGTSLTDINFSTNFLGSLYSVTYWLTLLACLISFMVATLMYISSSGNPDKIKKARKYVEAGITSLIVVVGARVFFGLLSGVQEKASGQTSSAAIFTFAGKTMGDILSLGLEFGFVLVALLIAWGGINYLFSTGNPDKIKKATAMITYALLGLVVLILFYALSQFIINFIGYNNANINPASNPSAVEQLQINTPGSTTTSP